MNETEMKRIALEIAQEAVDSVEYLTVSEYLGEEYEDLEDFGKMAREITHLVLTSLVSLRWSE